MTNWDYNSYRWGVKKVGRPKQEKKEKIKSPMRSFAKQCSKCGKVFEARTSGIYCWDCKKIY